MKRLFKSTDSGKFSYLETEGRGPTLLFLHGNSLCADIYHHQLDYFGNYFHCIALDFLGHGQSSEATGGSDYGISGCVNQIIEFIDALQLKELIIIGHSLGGHAIIEALPNLDCIIGVVLVGSPPFSGETLSEAFLPDPSKGMIFESVLIDEDSIQLANLFVNENKLELVDWVNVITSIENTNKNVRPSILAGFVRCDFQDELSILNKSKIKKMSIIGGLDDFINQNYFNQSEIKNIFVNNIHVISDCKHVPQIESPVVFNQYLELFIRDCFPKKTIRTFVLNDSDRYVKRYLPLREPTENQISIQIAATCVNPIDYKIWRGGLMQSASKFPSIRHTDVAGTVVEIGDNVTQFKLGDHVFGSIGEGRSGILSDVVNAEESLISHLPDGLSFEQAAALPLISIAAWNGLYSSNLKENMTILVHGGCGGVGHITIQLAKLLGAIVYTTVSSDLKSGLAKKLGALRTINYQDEEVEDYVSRLTEGRGFDVVFDTVGNSNISKSILACKFGGDVITTLSNYKVDLNIAVGRGVSLHFINVFWPVLSGLETKYHGYILSKIKELIEKNKLKISLDVNVMPFENIELAHKILASGSKFGKVVLIH